MDIVNMYKLINEKDENMDKFILFLDFMILNINYVDALNKEDKLNFLHHFNKIPSYTREALGKLRGELIGKVGNIVVTTKHLSESIDKFTKLD